jgi:DNA-binding CsgD family transcriptional regulator
MIPLARQEYRIARMIVGGLRQPEIAAELGIATNTVKTYVARIRAKTGYQRESAQLSFEVFLDRLLQATPVATLDRGISCFGAVFTHVRHIPELRDAARLMRAGFPDWNFHQSYAIRGERYTEWQSREGQIATVRNGRWLHYRSETLRLDEDETSERGPREPRAKRDDDPA